MRRQPFLDSEDFVGSAVRCAVTLHSLLATKSRKKANRQRICW